MRKDLEHCTEFDHQKYLYEARHAKPKDPPMGLQNRIEELRGLDLSGRIGGIRRWVDFGMSDLVTGLVISEALAIPEDTARLLLADAFSAQAARDMARIASLAYSPDADRDMTEEQLRRSAQESSDISARLRRDDFYEVAAPIPLPQQEEPPKRRGWRIFG